MLSLKSRRHWKKILKKWIKASEATDDAKLKMYQQFKKYRRVLTDYDRIILLYGKFKAKTIINVEKEEFSERYKRLNGYSETELNEISVIYNILNSERTPEIRSKQEAEIKTPLPKDRKKASTKVRFASLGPNMPVHPLIVPKRQYRLKKRLTPRKILALGLVALIISAWGISIILQLNVSKVDVNFRSDKYRVDVNEQITFNWNIEGSFAKGFIIFGDGASAELNYSSKTIEHSYSTQGKYTPIVSVWNQQGTSDTKTLNIEVINDAPQFEISTLSSAQEDELVEIRIINLFESEVDLKEGILNYVYDFADNNQTTSKESVIKHRWENAGMYPILITLFDDQNALTQKPKYIEILNNAPEARFNYNITENKVKFSAEGTIDTESDKNSLMYIWDFGDNHTSFGKYVSHAYDTLGEYTVELCVKDNNGAMDFTSNVVSIGNVQRSRVDSNETESVVDLEILGPYTQPQNYEGQLVDFDVEVYDSLENEPSVSYSWYDQNGEQFSNNKRPSLLLDDGEYLFTLNVSNQDSQTTSEKIAVTVNNIAPEVFLTNYVYNGPSKRAELELKAYGYDSIFDINNLEFYWKITDGYNNYTFYDTVGKAISTIKFPCTDTAIYRGQVKVVDPSGKHSLATFIVNVIIDNNKNSVPDNIERLLDYTGESLETFSDIDNDLISDQCEQTILNTNFVNPDTDGDGLCDGLDASGVGELAMGTNPLNEDTDFDSLLDSIEFFGWNTTINTFEGSKVIHATSEPLIFDTDSDGLSDYEEYQIGSNPRSEDSDGDLLKDSIDPFPTNFDKDSDHISDKIELDIGTNLNNTDTDMDGISDGEEYYGWGVLGFKTDPLSADSDGDFASDSSELKFYSVQLENPNNDEIRVNVSNPISLHFPYMFQIAATSQISVALSFGEHGTNQTGEYGVNEVDVKNLTITIRHEGYNAILFQCSTNRTRHFSHVVDVSEIMNNISLGYNYFGNYVLEVDDPTAGCLVEQFEFEFSRYLDPHNEDFDGDGIFDGVEMNLLVEGTKRYDFKDMYNSTQRIISSVEYDSNETITYQLEVQQIGRAFDAQLYLTFEAISSINSGTIIELELMKKYLDYRKTDTILLHFRDAYSSSHYDKYSKTINLTKWEQENPEFNLFGEYILTVRLETWAGNQEKLNLTAFYIETETYVDTGPLDTHAWLTDPALNDTDGDGWSDSYEIFTSHTNPLSDDSDGDGALDSNDREPVKNIILEISPIFASFRNQMWPTTNPILKIGMYLRVNDLADPNSLMESSKVGFFTNNKKATTDIRVADWYITHETAWWNEGEGTHYYIDISDDFTAQSNNVQFYFTLWESAPLGDINRFGDNWYSDTFDMGSTELTQTLNVQHTGILGRVNEITISVTKIVVEKVNTIAIYSENETQFSGHYQHQERMNVFQLHITDSGDGTPFVQGVNAIVIPTSLFSKTKLNAFIENGQLDQTVLYSDIAGEFAFYSVDRDGNIVDEECGDADFVFVRYEMTSQEAMELLELLLTCAVNQSLEENNTTMTELDTTYSYVSTKFNETNAAMLNIPNTIARFVLWGGGHEDSPYGTEPETVDPIFIFLCILPFILPISGLLTLFDYSIERVNEFNTKNADVVGLTFLTFLANLLWTLIRAALIIVAYILLALEVLTISIIFLGIGVILDITSLFSGFDCKWGINWAIPYGVDTRIAFIQLDMEGYDVTVEAYITWTYWEYFDIFFPFLTMDSKVGSLLEDTIGAGNNVSAPPELGCGYDHLGGLRYDFHACYRQRPQGYAPNYVKLMLVSPSGIVYNYSMVETPSQSFDTYYNWVRFNRTIDFGQEFDFNERQGQWHYSFITQASVTNIITKWPEDGYAIGPLFHDNRSYFISSYLEPFSGYIDSVFNFTATGCDFLDGFTPEQVYLKILWPNETIITFPMNLASTFNYGDLSFNTYSRTINFSTYIAIDKPTLLNHYFEAVFSDGSVSVMWDYQVIDENTEYDEYTDEGEEFEYILCWFEGPLLKPKVSGNNKPPIIWKWYVEDLTWNRLLNDESGFQPLSPISDEFILRFWIYVEDPDGTHEHHWNNGFEFVPKLNLINLDSPNEVVDKIDMKWTGGHYGPGPEGYDEYFIDLLGDGHYAYKYEQTSDLMKCNFTSGAWMFSFELADNQSHITTECPYNKIWHIGSLENMKNTFFYGFPNGIGVEGIVGSIIISILYIVMAFLASIDDPKTQLAAQIIAGTLAVVDIVSNFIAFSTFVFSTNDMGSLIGLGFHMFVQSVGFLIALSLSKDSIGSFNFNFLNQFAGLMMILFVFDMNDDIMGIGWEENEEGISVPSQENDPPTLDQILGGYPMMIVSFLSTIIGLTTTLVLFSGAAKTGTGTEHIKTIVIIHTIISVLLSSLCFFAFFLKSGFFHIFYDISIYRGKT